MNNYIKFGILLPGVWLAFSVSPACAHQEHEEQAFSANSRAAQPARNEDGSLTIPLGAQAGLSMLTVTETEAPQVLTMPARVVPDPRHSALISAPYSASVFEPPQGFPRLGEQVTQGQTLAILKPSLTNVELSDIKAELAIAIKDKVLTKRQIDIYTAQLGHPVGNDTTPVYQRMKSDLAGALGRIKAYQTGLAFRGQLRAPIPGVVSNSNLSVGRVVSPGDVLMQIVQPAHLWVSALSFDTGIQPPARTYALTPDQQRVELALVGKSLRLQGQALPLQYEVVKSPVKLAVGQTLTLHLDATAADHPLRLPVSSVSQQGAGKAQVWVQTATERFAQRDVSVKPVGNEVEIMAGLQTGERVVSVVPPALKPLFFKP